MTCADKTRLWDTKNGSLIAQLGQHNNISAIFNNDGTRILTRAINNDCAQIWDARTYDCLATLEECTQAYYNHACNVIITSIVMPSPIELQKTIKIYDAQTFKCITTINMSTMGDIIVSPRGNRIIMLDNLPGRERLIVLDSDGTILKLGGS